MIYALDWDDPISGDTYDATLIKFPGWESTMGLNTFTERIPNPAQFEADFEYLPRLDLPYNDMQWLIASSKALATFLEVGHFQHTRFPVAMVDNRIPTAKRIKKEDNTYKTEVLNYDFTALQVNESLDCFDWDNSVYMPDEDYPGQVFAIEELVLKIPINGFPPLFHVSVIPLTIFAPEQTKLAYETSGLQGLVFIPIDEYIM